MSGYIERIYALTNSEIVTPHNLLDNIKLENYNEVKYFKEKKMLLCEMWSIEDDEEVRYLYEFSMDNKLERATIFFEDEKMEIFNRGKELETAIKNYEGRKTKKIN